MQVTDSGSMHKTRNQMVLVAVLVCLFAAGMAGLLNFFKYRANAERLSLDRLVVTGHGIESSIRSSLAIGMQCSDLGTLQDKLNRELGTADLIKTIEVFDTEGNALYSTDRLRAARGADTKWLEAARDAEGGVWAVKDGVNSAVGIPVRNNFGLIVGYLALRYNEEQIREPIMRVGRQLALMSLLQFMVTSVLASLALYAVMGGISRDMRGVAAEIEKNGADPTRLPAGMRGPFAKPLERFFTQVRTVEMNIGMLHKQVKPHGDSP